MRLLLTASRLVSAVSADMRPGRVAESLEDLRLIRSFCAEPDCDVECRRR